VSTSKNSVPRREASFGYREALAEVSAQLTASEARRLQAERTARRRRWQHRSVLVDERGLALAV
jgi:hypothetical protein